MKVKKLKPVNDFYCHIPHSTKEVFFKIIDYLVEKEDFFDTNQVRDKYETYKNYNIVPCSNNIIRVGTSKVLKAQFSELIEITPEQLGLVESLEDILYDLDRRVQDMEKRLNL